MESANFLAQVTVALEQARDNSYVQAAGLAWLAYDILLTFPSEVEYIWRRRFNLPALLYLLCRYYALFHLCFIFSVSVAVRPSIQACTASLYISAFGVPALSWAVDLLLILRLHSLYGRKWRLTGSLVGLYLVQGAVTVAMATNSVIQIRITPAPAILGSRPGCFSTTNSIPRFIVTSWVIAMIFGAVIFGLTIKKLIQFRRMEHTPSKVLVVFVRDGALFFGLILALQIVNVVVTAVAPLPLFTICLPLQSAVYGIAISRLMLNLRASSCKGDDESCGETTVVTPQVYNTWRSTQRHLSDA
ncbi:hypothetical protein AURDEDRAFT_117384 [Auricularia subglabra TFB-10046 SS5]|uniref:DUF6533 domain-containing protein n=1 Tax=Auricularia subglabra (strain TFB-10046 / SS5) TaxID=717982 RepID=J0WRT7_AURST|nr:hypothetical protein AURDEDRAFT_117384 [Auricularia subglabra TFB-10046 SS5]